MAKRKRKSKKSNDILVVQSKVREHIKGLGDFNIGSDLMEAVSTKVEDLLQAATRRASDNGRKTIQARDV